MCTLRQLISITRPVVPSATTQSPMPSGRSMRSIRPETTLPSGSCSARPTTMPPTPSAVSAPEISCFHTSE